MNLGSLLREQGPGSGGGSSAAAGCGTASGLVAGWVNLAILERERRHPAKVETYLRKAFALNPARWKRT